MQVSWEGEAEINDLEKIKPTFAQMKHKLSLPRAFPVLDAVDADGFLMDIFTAPSEYITNECLKLDALNNEDESFVVSRKNNKRQEEKQKAARLHAENVKSLRREQEEKVKYSEMLKRVARQEKEQELQQKFEVAQLAARQAELNAKVNRVVDSLIDNVIAEFAKMKGKDNANARIESEGKDQDPAQEAQRLVLPASVVGDGSARDT